ncbi:hypothetical protein KC640_03025, partial [Candidatus Dojkabacteria bacterium]|nr:hypothetical protein [Candidatus Dojkabacteria bacterium]
SENVPIAEVIPELVQEGEVAPWVQVRDVYSWLKVGMLIGWGVNLLLLILFIILAQPKLGGKMQGVGTVAILSGVLVTASGILISLSHSLVLSNLPAMSADFDPQLAENLLGGITTVIGTLTARLLFAGIAIMVCGLLVYVLGVILGRRAKSKLP